MGEELATWEDEQEVKAKFPTAPAWGQAGAKEDGNVMDLPKDQDLEDDMSVEQGYAQPSEQAVKYVASPEDHKGPGYQLVNTQDPIGRAEG